MTYWRPFHVLMYLALFIGIVHANYRGIDFVNSPIAGIYDGLFAAVLAAFVFKPWQFFRARERIRKVKSMEKRKRIVISLGKLEMSQKENSYTKGNNKNPKNLNLQNSRTETKINLELKELGQRVNITEAQKCFMRKLEVTRSKRN